MKTAISIPDPVFRAAERAAKRLGISRSQFYSLAVATYLERLRRSDVSARLDVVYAEGPAHVPPSIERAQTAAAPREEW